MARTTNMNLNLPDPLVTEGPKWAEDLNKSITNVDKHNHNTSKGVKITPTGLDIDRDLSVNGHNVTNARSIISTNNPVPLDGAGDVNAVYASGGNLYWNNNGGGDVQITDDTIMLAATDGISRSYDADSISSNTTILSTDTFSAYSVDTTGGAVAITLPAAGDVIHGRFYLIKDAGGAAGTNNITITPDGSDLIDGAASFVINSNYKSYMIISDGVSSWQVIYKANYINGSNISTSAITTAKLADDAISDTAQITASAVTTTKIANATLTSTDFADASVTKAKRSAANIQVSSSSGLYQVNDVGLSSVGPVTNLSVSVTGTNNRPIAINLIPDGSADPGIIGYTYFGASTITKTMYVHVRRNGSTIYSCLLNDGAYTQNQSLFRPGTMVQCIDTSPVVGTNTYQIYISSDDSPSRTDLYFRVEYLKLVAYEL